jgi:hypothetical protein
MMETARTANETAFLRTTPFLTRIPSYAYLGLALNIAAWISSWGRIGPYGYTFFPLWFGFILFLDGLNVARRGTSPLMRNRARFAALFLFSVPVWWVFEAFNAAVQNWHYVFDRQMSGLEYNFWASLAFSTVLPAEVEMAELLTSFKRLRPHLLPPALGPRLSRRGAVASIVVGMLMAALAVGVPQYFYALIWGSVIFVLDPINNLAGRKSAWGHLLARDWRFLGAISLAALCNGFFWEMWNSRALPHWYYTVPIVNDSPHLFAMPLPGYLGYLPFGIELFAMYQFGLLITGRRKDVLIV